MAYQTLRQEYLQVPAVTRAYTTACVLTTLAVVMVAPLCTILCPFARVRSDKTRETVHELPLCVCGCLRMKVCVCLWFGGRFELSGCVFVPVSVIVVPQWCLLFDGRVIAILFVSLKV